MVSTPFEKYESKWVHLSQIGMKTKKHMEATNTHPDILSFLNSRHSLFMNDPIVKGQHPVQMVEEISTCCPGHRKRQLTNGGLGWGGTTPSETRALNSRPYEGKTVLTVVSLTLVVQIPHEDRYLNTQTPPEKAFRGSKCLLRRYLQDFGRLVTRVNTLKLGWLRTNGGPLVTKKSSKKN